MKLKLNCVVLAIMLVMSTFVIPVLAEDGVIVDMNFEEGVPEEIQYAYGGTIVGTELGKYGIDPKEQCYYVEGGASQQNGQMKVQLQPQSSDKIHFRGSIAVNSKEITVVRYGITPYVNIGTEEEPNWANGSFQDMDGGNIAFIDADSDGELEITVLGKIAMEDVLINTFYTVDMVFDCVNHTFSTWINGLPIFTDEKITGRSYVIPTGGTAQMLAEGNWKIGGIREFRMVCQAPNGKTARGYFDNILLQGYDSAEQINIVSPVAENDIIKISDGKIYLGSLSEVTPEKIFAGLDSSLYQKALILDSEYKESDVVNNNSMLRITGLNGVHYFYKMTARKADIYTETFGARGQWWAMVNGSGTDGGRPYSHIFAGSGKESEDLSLKIVLDKDILQSNTTINNVDYRLSSNYMKNKDKLTNGDNYVLSCMIKAEDYNSTREIKLLAPSASAGGTIASFNSDGTITAGWNNVNAGTYKTGEWYNVTAVLTFNEYNYKLYINGEEIVSDNLVLKNWEGRPALADINTVRFEVNPVNTTVSEMLHSETYIDDFEMFIGGYLPSDSKSKLTVTGYEINDKTVIRSNEDMAVSELKGLIGGSDNYRIYGEDFFAPLADDDFLGAENYVVETAADGKTLHTYKIITEISLKSAEKTDSGDKWKITGEVVNKTSDDGSFIVIAILMNGNKMTGITYTAVDAKAAMAAPYEVNLAKKDGATEIEVWMIDSWSAQKSLSKVFKLEI